MVQKVKIDKNRDSLLFSRAHLVFCRLSTDRKILDL